MLTNLIMISVSEGRNLLTPKADFVITYPAIRLPMGPEPIPISPHADRMEEKKKGRREGRRGKRASAQRPSERFHRSK